MDDLYLTPPNLSGLGMVRMDKAYALRLQNTGDLFYMDKDDWNKAKHCRWWWDKEVERPMNLQGTYFEDFVGIKARRGEGNEKSNFERACYTSL